MIHIIENGKRNNRGLLRVGVIAWAVGTALGVQATTIAWSGANTSTNADWSLAKNWSTGAVPTGSDTAKISVDGGRLRMLTLTPPLDFTGSIYVNGETTAWDTQHPVQVILNVLDGATWTVTGIGYVYATPNIASRIASTFTGSVIIPKGYAFVAPTDLNEKVEFVGDGTLTLSSATQLKHISGFTGTLIWAGSETLTPEDTEYLQGRTWQLANGATLTLEKRILTANPVQRIPDWTEASGSWQMSGSNIATSAKFDFDTSLPHALADGSLALVTDAAQIRSASFVGQKLKWTDSWGVSFRWTPEMPTPSKFTKAGKSQTVSGTFGLYFTTNTTCANGAKLVPVKKAGGFRVYEYDKYHFEWDRNFSSESDFICPIQKTELDAIGGINFRNPIDFTVTFQNGRMTVQMRQGEKYLATFRKFNEAYTMPVGANGYYLCLGASSDWWGDGDDTVPWGTHTISHFKGWYRSRETGRWVDEGRSFYPFTSANAVARQYWKLSDGTVTNVTSAFEADGSFKLEDYEKMTRTVLMSEYYVKNTTPCLVTYDLVGGQGTGAQNTEYTKVGFLRSSYPITNWQYDYDNLGNQNIDTWSVPLMLKTYWYGADGDSVDGYRMAWSKFRCGFRYGDSKSSETESGKFLMPTMFKNTTQHSALINDGSAGIYYQMYPTSCGDSAVWPHENGNLYSVANAHWLSNGTGGANRGSWANGEGMRLVFEHYSSWGRVDTWLKNVKVKVLKDNQIAYLSGEFAVAANATATFKADAQFASSKTEATELAAVSLAEGATLRVATDVSGSKVVIDRVTVGGSGATLAADTATVLSGEIAYDDALPTEAFAVTGSATFAGDTLTFIVPDAWRRMKCGTVTLLDASALAALPAHVRIVTDAGTDMTARTDFTTAGGIVTANWTHGLKVIIR